jgi:hypothetical protein
MSAVDALGLVPSLNLIFEDELAAQMNRAVVLSKFIQKRPVKGKQVSWVARIGTAVGSAQSDGASISTYNSDSKVPATLPIATYQDSFKLDGRAVAIAANAGCPAELGDLFAEHVMEASERVASAINIDLFAGTGATTDPVTLAGLDSTVLLADTGTYANVSRNTYSQWKSNVLANNSVARPLSFQLMRDMRRTIYTACGLQPDLILSDPIQFENYGLLFGDKRRYVSEVNVGGQVIKLDGGYQALEFDGIPVIQDKDAPAGSMRFLNTREMALRVLPPAALQLRTDAGQMDLTGTREEQFDGGETGIMARIQRLSNDGDFYVFQVIAYLQLQVRRPNSCGILSDLA